MRHLPPQEITHEKGKRSAKSAQRLSWMQTKLYPLVGILYQASVD